MLGKVAVEERWTTPEELENNDPGKFVAAGTGDRLTKELLDIHDMHLKQKDENGLDFMVPLFSSAGYQGYADNIKAEAMATLANDRLEEEIVLKNSTRLAVFAAISMYYLEQSG